MLSSILCLLAVCFAGALATEECHFNEYTNSKLVSDYSAVLVSINSLADCLSYLKNNKLTHKVVAFDAETKRCCSVLQSLSYEVQSEYGWTTFEIREHNNMSTQQPIFTTTTNRGNWSSTTQISSNATLAVLGVCDSAQYYYYFGGTKSFSVFSYDFNVCKDFNSSRIYDNNMRCGVKIINTDWYSNLKVEIIVNSERNFDILTVVNEYGDFNQSFSGAFFEPISFVIRGRSIYLSWITDSSIYQMLGFCLTATGTFEEATTGFNSTTQKWLSSVTAPTGFNTTRNWQNNSTVIATTQSGFPDDVYATISVFTESYKLNGSKSFSVFSYPFDLCYNTTSFHQYYSGMNNTIFIESVSSFKNFEVNLKMDCYKDEDYLLLYNWQFFGNYTGKTNDSFIIPGNYIYLQWTTGYKYYNGFGFCLTLRETYESLSSVKTLRDGNMDEETIY